MPDDRCSPTERHTVDVINGAARDHFGPIYFINGAARGHFGQIIFIEAGQSHISFVQHDSLGIHITEATAQFMFNIVLAF